MIILVADSYTVELRNVKLGPKTAKALPSDDLSPRPRLLKYGARCHPADVISFDSPTSQNKNKYRKGMFFSVASLLVLSSHKTFILIQGDRWVFFWGGGGIVVE